jgi:hypothetical protein
MISAHSARDVTVQNDVGSEKKEKREKGRASRSSPARVKRLHSDIETERGGFYFCPSL